MLSTASNEQSALADVRQMLALRNAPWRWRVGVQAALALGIPAAIIVLLGFEREALVASMGAFTALYYPNVHTADRLKLLPIIAAGFSAYAFLGTFAGASPNLTAIFLIVLTAFAAVFSLGTGLGSPGPMMFVLVAGVNGMIASAGSYADSRFGIWTTPMLVTLGAASAYFVTVAPLLLPRFRRRNEPAPNLRDILRFDRWDLTSRIIAYRVIAAASIATLVAVPAGFSHAYWVIMVAGVVLQVSHSLRHTISRVIHRMLGTIAGVAVFALVVQLELSGLQLVLMLALLQGIVEVVVARHYALALLFITPLSLTIATANHDIPVSVIATERIVDTFLGVVIAMIVLLASEWLINRAKDERGML